MYWIDYVLIGVFALLGILFIVSACFTSFNDSKEIPHGTVNRLFVYGAFMIFAARVIYYMQQHADLRP
jgi:hypothetical protein